MNQSDKVVKQVYDKSSKQGEQMVQGNFVISDKVVKKSKSRWMITFVWLSWNFTLLKFWMLLLVIYVYIFSLP